MGVMVLKKLDNEFSKQFTTWLNETNKIQFQLTHHTKSIVEDLIAKAPYN